MPKANPANPDSLDDPETREPPAHQDSPDKPRRRLASKCTRLLAPRALAVSPETMAHRDPRERLDHLANPAPEEDSRNRESPAHLDPMASLDNPDSPERLDSPDNPPAHRRRSPLLQAHLERLVHLDSPVSLEPLDSPARPDSPARKDLPEAQDSQEMPEHRASPANLDSLATPESAESVPNTVPWTAECSSRTAHEDVKKSDSDQRKKKKQKNSSDCPPLPRCPSPSSFSTAVLFLPIFLLFSFSKIPPPS